MGCPFKYVSSKVFHSQFTFLWFTMGVGGRAEIRWGVIVIHLGDKKFKIVTFLCFPLGPTHFISWLFQEEAQVLCANLLLAKADYIRKKTWLTVAWSFIYVTHVTKWVHLWLDIIFLSGENWFLLQCLFISQFHVLTFRIEKTNWSMGQS